MADPFVGQIQIFPYTFAPYDWAWCTGTELAVRQFQVLYAVIGNTFGGTPNSTFKLPDLRQRAVVGYGQGPGLSPHAYGAKFGDAAVTLNETQLPQHSHAAHQAAIASGKATSPTVAANSWAGWTNDARVNIFTNTETAPVVAFSPTMVGLAGGGAAHENRQPYLAMPFCIATNGIFPVRP